MCKIRLTSSTDPKEPVPSRFPVVVTPGRTNCCSCVLVLKACVTSLDALLKNAIFFSSCDHEVEA